VTSPAVEVVELALGDGVVDVDGGEQELAGLLHLVQALHTGGGLLGDTHAGGHDLVPALGVRCLGSGRKKLTA
jgi:hypothetical protein